MVLDNFQSIYIFHETVYSILNTLSYLQFTPLRKNVLGITHVSSVLKCPEKIILIKLNSKTF